MNSKSVSRREGLKLIGAGVAAGVMGGAGRAARAADAPAAGGRALRVAHLTDVHIQPERGAADGFAQCLRHVQSQKDKPDLILFTGDNIMDAYRRDEARTKLQWELWQRVLKAECSIPHRALLGNHDIWGWDKAKSLTTGSEPLWGKRFACDQLGIERSYYSFDQAGWHFVMLDSVQPFEDGTHYLARLDDAQRDWLAADLRAGEGKPVMVLSHIPVFSITPFMAGKPEASPDGRRDTTIGQGGMHTDWPELKALFREHGGVKLAVSGHTHLVDRIDYLGTSYCCDGAVSGGWWKRPHLGECDAGYALIDLYPDGRFERHYVTYDWRFRDAQAVG